MDIARALVANRFCDAARAIDVRELPPPGLTGVGLIMSRLAGEEFGKPGLSWADTGRQ